MSAIITNNYRVTNVETFLKSLEGSPASNYLYTFIGNSLTWSDSRGAGAVNDTTVPPPVDTLDDFNFIWNNMLALKRVQRANVSAGILKRNWTANTYYDIYRHDYGLTGVTGLSENGSTTTPLTLADARYYVVTKNGNVYICVGNNRGQNASLIDPQTQGTGIGFSNFTLSDGYVWRYIATVSSTDYANFSTIEFHPVKTITTPPDIGDSYESQYLAQEAAKTNGGAIYNVLVGAAGNNTDPATQSQIIDSPNALISIKGDGTGLQIRLHTNASGGVSYVSVLNPGSGYSYCSITLPSFSGTKLTPILTPRYGLGARPVQDLNAYYLLISSTLTKNEGDGDFTTSNNYRQVGLVLNPLIGGGTTVANASTLDASITLTLANATVSFEVDAEVVNNANGTRGRVIDWAPDVFKLRVNFGKPTLLSNWGPVASFSALDTIYQITSGGNSDNVAIASVTDPEVSHHTGDILYFENRRPIQRDPNQIEEIHIAIEF
jgi:hypothetical protein